MGCRRESRRRGERALVDSIPLRLAAAYGDADPQEYEEDEACDNERQDEDDSNGKKLFESAHLEILLKTAL